MLLPGGLRFKHCKLHYLLFGAWTKMEEHGQMESVGILMEHMPSMPAQGIPIESIEAQSIVIQLDQAELP